MPFRGEVRPLPRVGESVERPTARIERTGGDRSQAPAIPTTERGSSPGSKVVDLIAVQAQQVSLASLDDELLELGQERQRFLIQGVRPQLPDIRQQVLGLKAIEDGVTVGVDVPQESIFTKGGRILPSQTSK